MKKIITTALIAISLSANAQKVDSTKAKEDSITYVSKILSLSDIDRIMTTKKNVLSVSDWEIFWKVINGALLPDAIKEYQAQKPKHKK
jgi:hypothetical protein